MSTFERNYSEARRLAERAHHFSYGDGANAAAGQSMATEAVAFALLALIDTLRESAPVEFAVAPVCPCGCSGGPDQCTCGMRCVCSSCVYCDLIMRGDTSDTETDAEPVGSPDSVWLDPAVRAAVRESIVAQGADEADEADGAEAAPRFHLPVETVPVSDVLAAPREQTLAATPLAVAFGGAMAAPNFAAGNLVNISDPGHKRYGQRGSVVGYVYDPLGVVVEYDNLGNTTTVRPDQLMHHRAFVEQESRAEFEAEAAQERFANAENGGEW